MRQRRALTLRERRHGRQLGRRRGVFREQLSAHQLRGLIVVAGDARGQLGARGNLGLVSGRFFGAQLIGARLFGAHFFGGRLFGGQRFRGRFFGAQLFRGRLFSRPVFSMRLFRGRLVGGRLVG